MTGFYQTTLDSRTTLNMFEVFKNRIVQELGQLHPDWFEQLTAKASSDAQSEGPETSRASCVQEEAFKVPQEKAAIDSQLFSTPKLFKCQTTESHLTPDEELHFPNRGSSCSEHGDGGESKTLPWGDSSPCLFGSAKASQPDSKHCRTQPSVDWCGLLDTPKSSIAVSAKRISESLGAQMDPDVSWTSSLNTPPVMSPTIILTKKDDSTCSVTPSGDKHVVFVRKLFPTASELCDFTGHATEKHDSLTLQQCEVNSQADSMIKKADGQGLASAEEGGGLWRQTLPDVIEDREVRSTVASVLEGAEEVLSIFFNKRVKARERGRRRQAASQREAGLGPPGGLANGRFGEPGTVTGGPEHEGSAVEAQECGTTQWTPLTLSDISDTNVESTRHSALPTEGVTDKQPNTTPKSLAHGGESQPMERVVPASALARCDPVLPSRDSTPNVTECPPHNASPCPDMWLCGQEPESKHSQQADKENTGSGSVIPLSSTERQDGALACRPGCSQLSSSSVESAPAPTTTRKPPRKFVYSVQSPSLSRRAQQNAAVRGCTVPAPAAPYPGESVNDKPYVGEQQIGETVKQAAPAASNKEDELCHLSQICTPLTEDYSQQGKPARTPSSRTDTLCSGVQRSFPGATGLDAVRPRNRKLPTEPFPLKPELKEKLSATDRRDGLSVSSPNDSAAVLTETAEAAEMVRASNVTRTTCETQRHESGYHTTPGSSAVSRSSRVTDNHPLTGFKTASNRIISLPEEAIQKAKTLLDEAAEGSLSSTVISMGKLPQESKPIERNHRSLCNTMKNTGDVNTAGRRPCTPLAQVRPHQRINNSLTPLSVPSPKPGFTGFKTASNSTIHLSSENLRKAKQLFKDIEEENFPEKHPSGDGCRDVKGTRGSEEGGRVPKSLAGLMPAPLPPLLSPEPKCTDTYGSLTASQRADVTELCSFLEEADSQFEFTQFKQAKQTTGAPDDVHTDPTSDKEVDPDFLTGIDFDDSFSSDCEKQTVRKHKAGVSVPEAQTVSPHHKQSEQDCSIKSKTVDILSYDDINKHADSLHSERARTACVPKCNSDSGSNVGFSSASGKKITVSNEILKRASKVFDDLDVHFASSRSNVPDVDAIAPCSDLQHGSVIQVKKTGSQGGILTSQSNTLGAHGAFTTPKIDVVNQNPKIKKPDLLSDVITPIRPSHDSQITKEGSINCEPNLPSASVMHSMSKTSDGMPIASHAGDGILKGVASTPPVSSAPYPPITGAEKNSTKRPPLTADLHPAGGEKVSIDKANLRRPLAVCTKDTFESDTGEEMSDKHSNSMSIAQQVAGFRTARGTAVNVSERLLSKAREMFADLEENCEGANRGGSRVGKQEKSDALIKHKELRAKCAVTSETPAEKRYNRNSGRDPGKTSPDHTVVDKPDSLHMENEVHVNAACSRAENTLNLNRESNTGSTTASVNKVCLSEKAILEAKTTSNKCDNGGACQTTVASNVNGEGISPYNPPGGCGFSTAGGKRVAVSKKALRYARSLLKDCEEIRDPEPEVNNANVSPLNPQGKNSGGFKTASGKRVSVSPKALEQAKNFFKSCDDAYESETNRAVKGDHIGAKPRASPIDPVQRNYSFSSGSDEVPPVSAKSVLEVKAVFGNCEHAGDSAMCSEVNETTINANSHYDTRSNAGKVNCGFSTAAGKKVSVSESALLKANALLKECDEEHRAESVRPDYTKGSAQELHRKNVCGFSTASGKGVAVSTKALQEAKALFRDCDDTSSRETRGTIKGETARKNSSTGHNDPENSNCGFSTASGVRVSVSKKALLKAKALLNECCEVESGDSGTHFRMECTSGSAQDPLCESSCGLSPVGGKGQSASAKVLCKTKPELKDRPGNEIAAEAGGKRLNVERSSFNNPGKYNFGFSTASGNQVSVSLEALEEAKAKLKDCGDDSGSVMGAETNVDHVRLKSSFARPNPEKGTSVDIMAADGKPVSVSEMAPQSTKAVPEKPEKVAQSVAQSGYKGISQGTFSRGQARVHENSRENIKATACPSAAPAQEHCVPRKAPVEAEKREVKQSDVAEATQDGSSFLNLRSLGLDDCTITQQRYLEQEAVACTRALLEDEDLDEQGFQRPSEEPPLQRGKRPKCEDADMKGQPPLKRRLLTDFDRTSDCGKLSAFTALKSSPNVTLRDRRVFKYDVPLQPNVTRPFGSDKKSNLDQKLRKSEPQIVAPDSFLRDGKPRVGAVFVPPFRKGANPESQRPSLPAESGRPTSVLAPPFRKTSTSHGGSRSSCLSEAPVPNVFTPPLKKNSGSATDPGSVSHGNVRDKACGDESGRGLIPGAVPERKEAERERTMLAPGEHEAGSSDMEQMIQNLQLARDIQDMRIRKKKRQIIKPQPGSLFLAKTSGVPRVSLRSAVGGTCPAPHTQEELYKYGVHREVSQICSDSAESFHFRCGDFFRQEVLTEGDGVQLADGGWLIPSNGGTVGKEEFYRALCDTPGVDPKLISEDWLYNHYRWVVWKQASMERSFPEAFGSLCLTPEQILLQLKYRYDVEVDHSRRSALRKIMERDDTPAKTLILCVCGIASSASALPRPAQPETGAKVGSPNGVIWVTDGWYAIKALLDAPLTAMLHKGRLTVGGKVVTHGAELVGSQDACSPLEAPESLMLKISANSTRPARWDARLGFHCNPRPFRLPLSSLYSNGGLAGCVDVVVLRSYPTQWMEKKPGGVFVFRNDRAEEREARRHNDRKHKAMEVLFAKVQAQFEKDQEAENKTKSRRRRMSRQEIEALRDAEELYEAVESDPVYLESCLSEQQLGILSSYRQALGQERQARLQERFRRALEEAQESEGTCPNREVTPVWKLCVCDNSSRQSGSVYLLNIWRPSTELRSLLKEGGRYRIYQLATSEGKKRAGTAAIQLTATKKTKFQQIQGSPESLPELFQPRVSVSFRTLQDPAFRPLCGEVDIVGCVVSIADRHGPSPVLYLMDEQRDFVSVRSSCSLAQLALEELVKPQALLALSNLQLRHQPPGPVPALSAGELTLFSTNPKEPHLQETFAHLRSIVQGNKHFYDMAEEKLSSLIQSKGPSSLFSSGEVGQSPKMVAGQILQQPTRTSGLFTPVSRKPPPSVGTSENRDLKSLKRKRGLDFLSRIPSPPPVSPIWTTASPSVKKTFNPPRRCDTPQPTRSKQTPPQRPPPIPPPEEEWLNDEELAMINTQALLDGLGEAKVEDSTGTGNQNVKKKQ